MAGEPQPAQVPLVQDPVEAALALFDEFGGCYVEPAGGGGGMCFHSKSPYRPYGLDVYLLTGNGGDPRRSFLNVRQQIEVIVPLMAMGFMMDTLQCSPYMSVEKRGPVSLAVTRWPQPPMNAFLRREVS